MESKINKNLLFKDNILTTNFRKINNIEIFIYQ